MRSPALPLFSSKLSVSSLFLSSLLSRRHLHRADPLLSTPHQGFG